LCKSSRTDKTATIIRKIFQIILWLAAGAYIVVGVLAITGALGSAREASSLGRAYAVFGSMILIIGATAAVATFLANKWRGWLILAPLILCLGLPILLFAAFWIDMEKGEVHLRQLRQWTTGRIFSERSNHCRPSSRRFRTGLRNTGSFNKRSNFINYRIANMLARQHRHDACNTWLL
jgi:hypothetical protein